MRADTTPNDVVVLTYIDVTIRQIITCRSYADEVDVLNWDLNPPKCDTLD
jgi:hypothetical protein